MSKITIEREILERVLECLVQEGRSLRAAEVREALEKKAEPPGAIAQDLQKIADFGQDQELAATPAQGSVQAVALMDLDSIEHIQGGANGPTIRLRAFINAQTGPTAPQPPIDNAFVADGCEQFSPPAQPAGEVVVTKNEAGQIVAVTRQDDEGRILSVIAESAAQPAKPTIDEQVASVNAVFDAWRNGEDATLTLGLVAQPASMQPLPDHDNHHNALKCPYCNPRGLVFAEPAQPAPAAVPLTRPHCRECAKWAKAQADNKEWMDGVVRGREIVARLAAAENRMTDDLPPLSGLRPCLHQSPVP
jgi:hypothetical protein